LSLQPYLISPNFCTVVLPTLSFVLFGSFLTFPHAFLFSPGTVLPERFESPEKQRSPFETSVLFFLCSAIAFFLISPPFYFLFSPTLICLSNSPGELINVPPVPLFVRICSPFCWPIAWFSFTPTTLTSFLPSSISPLNRVSN